jgi:hypothetical protein
MKIGEWIRMNDTSAAYLMGRLLAALEHLTELSAPIDETYQRASVGAGYLTQILPRALQKPGVREALAPILAELPEVMPRGAWTAEQQGEFAIGYYHQRGQLAKGGAISADQKVKGRPAYPPGIEVRRMAVPLTDTEWDWVKKHLGPEERRARLLAGYIPDGKG